MLEFKLKHVGRSEVWLKSLWQKFGNPTKCGRLCKKVMFVAET